MVTPVQALAYVLVPTVVSLVGLACYLLAVRTGRLTTGETRTSAVGAEVPVFRSVVHRHVAIAAMAIGMLVTATVLLIAFDVATGG